MKSRKRWDGNIRGLGTHRASYRRWPKPRASCTDGSSLAKKGARAVCGEARLALSGQKPRASCAVGSQSRDRRHPRAEFPQFRMPLQRGVRARDSGPRGESLENSSPRAILANLARATRGVHEPATQFWKPCGVLGDATKETTGSCAGGRPNRERRGPPWFPFRASRRPYCSSEA